MKTAIRLVVLFAVFVSIAAARADTRYETYTTFFDSSGNEVGYRYLGCYGNNWGGTETSNYSVEFISICEGEVQPVSCATEGLSSVGSCSDWCVSPGYALSYQNDMVPDCQGVCTLGEGPFGNPYCATCWKGTGSCPAKSRLKRARHPTLTAALETKMWEIFALLTK